MILFTKEGGICEDIFRNGLDVIYVDKCAFTLTDALMVVYTVVVLVFLGFSMIRITRESKDKE